MKYNRLTPWLLILVFVVPWGAAQIIYAKRDKLTFHTVQKGTLVSPHIQVQSQAFYDSAWLGKWQIVYTNQTITPMLNQLLEALGKDKHRVEYHFIAAPLTPGEIAIIDPQGWLIMHYPPNFDPINLLKDIKKILRYSRD